MNGTNQDAERLIGVNALDLHLAVVSGGAGRDGAFELGRPVIYGTAFPILPGIFLTAAHVYQAARSHAEHVALYRVTVAAEGGGLPVQLVQDAELFNGLDLAILRCDGHRGLLPFPLWFDALELLTPVTAVGFAVGFDVQYQSFVHRGFAGHVVTRREMFQLQPEQPPGYELSFVPPPGLSGAPLVVTTQHGHFAAAYVVHWWRTEIEGEDYRFGVAIDVEVLLGINSSIVGGPLARALGREPRQLRPATPPIVP